MPFPGYVPTLPAFLNEIHERFAEREAVVLGPQRLTYGDLETQSAAMARGLLAHGFRKGSRVGILMPNGPNWLVAFLAVTRIGAVAIPLNTFLKTPELHWALAHGDVQCLLTIDSHLGNDYLSRLEEASPELQSRSDRPLHLNSLPHLREVFSWGPSTRAWARPGSDLQTPLDDEDRAWLRCLADEISPADIMLMLYTSGSTGNPKGVLHTHGTVIRHSFNLVSSRDITTQDRVWTPMPFFWVGGLVFTLLGNLHAGAATICEESFDPEQTLALFEQERVSIALGWPHFGKALSEHPSRNDRDLSALRAGNVPDILGPDVVSPDPQRRPNALGMTETCGPHTWVEGNVLPEDLRGSFGTPVAGVEHKVIDVDDGEPVSRGTTGELCVRGYSRMAGLYKVAPEDTFDEDGFYHTGDVGYFDAQDVLYFKGRLGEMIKTGGANVTPSEVEAALASLPGVKAAHVVGIPDPERGQLVAAAVVPEPGAEVREPKLRQELKPLLSAYKIPRKIVFYGLDKPLPFTDSGKIDKLTLESEIAGAKPGLD